MVCQITLEKGWLMINSTKVTIKKHIKKSLRRYQAMAIWKCIIDYYVDGCSVDSNAVLVCRHTRFYATLKCKKPMSVYFDGLKINDENYTKSREWVA